VACIKTIEEGRAASYSPFISQQEVSADIIQISAVGNFSPKTGETKQKQLDVSCF
jgi:hypothetical protein